MGGDTLDRFWDLLKPSGRLVTAAADAESSTDPRAKSALFIVEQDGEQLALLGKLFERSVRSRMDPFEPASCEQFHVDMHAT